MSKMSTDPTVYHRIKVYRTYAPVLVHKPVKSTIWNRRGDWANKPKGKRLPGRKVDVITYLVSQL